MVHDLLTRLRQAQDRDADIDLIRRAIGRESVTGNEAGFARFLHDEMDRLALSPASGEFAPGRPNVWGERPGAGAGPRLMFTGHTDTVHVRGWRDRWQGDIRKDPFGAAVVDGHIWGRGASDLKGGICAALAALRLLDQAGIRLRGDVSYAFIGDEESGEPDSGISAGARDLVKRVATGEIAKPDFAIYVEPTSLSVYTAQIGFFIAEVKITGKSAYFGTPERGIDALRAAHGLLSAVFAHTDELEAGDKHDLVGNSSVLVTELKAGGYIAVPGECSFSVIRKLRPGESLDEAVDQFETVLRSAPTQAGIDIQTNYPAGRDHPLGGSPVEIDKADTDAATLAAAIAETAPDKGTLGGAPYWSEAPFLINEIGCPAVYCAPGDIGNAHTFEERLEVEEYLAAIRAFALFMTRYCGIADPT